MHKRSWRTTLRDVLCNSLQNCNFIKKCLQHSCSPTEFAKFLRTPILKKIWERLLLKTIQGSPGLSFFDNLHFPANIRLDEDVLKTPWKRLSSSSSHNVFKTSWSRWTCSPYSYIFRRRLQDVFKTSWSRPIYLSWSYVSKTSSRRFFRDIFKTSCKNTLKTFLRRFKTSSRRRAKSSSRCLAKTTWRHFQKMFKVFWKRLQDVLKTFAKIPSRGF